MNIIEETIDYIKKYGKAIVEDITLISEVSLKQYPRNIEHAFRIQIEILEGPATLVVGLPLIFLPPCLTSMILSNNLVLFPILKMIGLSALHRTKV